jgi:hypothetical protein
LSNLENNINNSFNTNPINYEQKLINIQKEYDTKLRKEIEKEKNRFMDLELLQVKVDMENEYTKKLESWKESIENT